MTEAEIQHAILARYGLDKRLKLWRSNSGAAQGRNGRLIRFGVKGQGDLSGILKNGRRLEIEVKSATGRQTPEQKAFGEMITKYNGIYMLVRSVETACSYIERHLDGL